MTKAERIFCISDLHLGPERPDISQAFESFLVNRAVKARSLFILGDLFDLWIGDDNVTDQSLRVSESLSKLKNEGTDVYLMHGNRDFLLGREFARKCNATLIAEPYVLEFHGQQYLLMHGDSLCTKDNDYMAFRAMVRNPDWQKEFLSKSLEERQAFAREARAKSKSMNSNKAEDIMDVTSGEVARVLGENQQHTLIHGHTHRPAVHDLDLDGISGKRIVLGDWDKKGWYLDISPQGTSLESFLL